MWLPGQNACVLMLSYLNFYPTGTSAQGWGFPRMSEIQSGALALQPWGLLPRVWPHSGHDVHEGCPLEGGSRESWGIFPKWKAGDQARPEYPETSLGKEGKKDKLQWRASKHPFRQETQLPSPHLGEDQKE